MAGSDTRGVVPFGRKLEAKESSPPQPERITTLSERLLRVRLERCLDRRGRLSAVGVEAKRDERASAIGVGDGNATAMVVERLLDDREPEPGPG
jgi:hypothetical protein